MNSVFLAFSKMKYLLSKQTLISELKNWFPICCGVILGGKAMGAQRTCKRMVMQDQDVYH